MNATPTPFYTFTGNLLAERTLTFEAWAPGATQRAQAEQFQVGGKGINVARALRRFGAPVTALCFAGGATGAECTAALEAEGLDFHAFPAAGPTRAGTVVAAAGRPETTFLGPDVSPGTAAVRACADFLDRLPEGVLAICGSVPGWKEAAFDPLRAALERWLNKGPLVVDTYGPPLAWLAERPVDLIKINRGEFDGLFPAAEKGCEAGFRLAGSDLPPKPRAWAITDGPHPVWVREGDGVPAAFNPPSRSENSPTGAGDVLLGCLLEARWRRALPLAQAMEFGLPIATAHVDRPF